MNIEKLYPYVVPEEYVLPMRRPDGFVQWLGHDVYVILVEDKPELFWIHTPEAILSTGLTFDEAHKLALSNLVKFVAGPGIDIQGHQSSDGTCFVEYSGHGLASSCLVLPNLYTWATQNLKTKDVLASVPQRELLILFTRKDRTFRDAMRRAISTKEKDARKPITTELFEITPNGVFPFSEQWVKARSGPISVGKSKSFVKYICLIF